MVKTLRSAGVLAADFFMGTSLQPGWEGPWTFHSALEKVIEILKISNYFDMFILSLLKNNTEGVDRLMSTKLSLLNSHLLWVLLFLYIP